MSDDYAEAIRTLERAVVIVLQLGIPCSGWVLQRCSSEGSWSAWLYVESDDDQDDGAHVSLFSEVRPYSSATEAAHWALIEAGGLLDDPPDVEIS